MPKPKRTKSAKGKAKKGKAKPKPTGPAIAAKPKLNRSELQLDGRAVRERWPVATEKRSALIDRLFTAINRKGEDFDRVAISAARVVILADHENLAQQRIDLAKPAESDVTARDAVLDAERADETFDRTRKPRGPNP